MESKDKAHELREKLVVVGTWRSSGNANNMWTTAVSFIKEAGREVLGVTNIYAGGHKKDGWWNKEVQEKCKPRNQHI